jgi:hypothetical protein
MPPISASLLVIDEGNPNSYAPNRLAASARKSAAMATMTQRFWSTEPNILPDMPAKTPSGTNMAAMPNTNAALRSAPSQRWRAWRAPKMLTVTATIGYTHGVRLTPRPPTRAASAA